MEDALGAPIKGFGEETSRRRRTHVSHAVYEKDGATHMRMRFYIKGIRNKAVVELDMKQVWFLCNKIYFKGILITVIELTYYCYFTE